MIENDADKPVVIYATFPSLEHAEKVADQLIKAELAACVNILPGMISIYGWKGSQQRDQEVVFLAKTRMQQANAVKEAIVEAHSYDVPAVIYLDISGGHAPYLEWIMSETSAGD
ncbi:MAG: divalent-cation tolerance protein CutA [Hyphomicrobiaceae bacterium]